MAARFLKRLLKKAHRDDVFFMSGAITFNLLLAVVPLLLLTVGLAGLVLQSRLPDPGAAVVEVVLQLLPRGTLDEGLRTAITSSVEGVVDRSVGFSFVGALILLWLSARLISTLRSVLRRVFEQDVSRPVIRGKLFDFRMVFLGAAFLLVALGAGRAATRLIELFSEALGIEAPGWMGAGVGAGLDLILMWLLLLAIYRMVPADRVDRRVGLWAASITALTLAGLKEGFAWYIRTVADFSSAYGNLATLAVLFFYLYYAAMAFVLGGQAAVVADGMRTPPSEHILKVLAGDPSDSTSFSDET